MVSAPPFSKDRYLDEVGASDIDTGEYVFSYTVMALRLTRKHRVEWAMSDDCKLGTPTSKTQYKLLLLLL